MRGLVRADEYDLIAGRLLAFGHPVAAHGLAAELRDLKLLRVVNKYRRIERRKLRDIRERRRMTA